MSSTLEQIQILVANREIQISEHGYDELAADGILAREIVAGVSKSELLEDYPNFHKGPCVLVLEHDRNGEPIHAVWGIPKGESAPAVLVTAYRPDPTRWIKDFRSRKK